MENTLSAPIAIEKVEQQSSYDSSLSHRHSYNEIFLFVKGGGAHMIDFKNHPIQDHSVHFVASNKIHLLNRAEMSYGYVIKLRNDFFQTEQLQNIAFLLIEYQQINLSEHLFSKLLTITKEIETELQTKTDYYNEILNNLVAVLLLNVKRYIKQSDTNGQSFLTDNSLYKSFYALLEKEVLNQRVVTYYANALNCTETKLNNELKLSTGKSAKQLIQKRLLLEAKRLLFHSKLSVKEIAFQLNFTDSSHFHRFFKKNTNTSPSDYRSSKSL